MSEWNSISQYPDHDCAVVFKLKGGQEELGSFRTVFRKDGYQRVPIGASGWIAFYRSGDDVIVEWKERS